MPRKKKAAQPEDMNAGSNVQAIEKSSQVSDQLNQHLLIINQQYGEGQPYDKVRIINEAKFISQQVAESVLALGRRYILLKEHEQHGDFLLALNDIGVPHRGAQKMMQVVIKFSDAPLTAQLGKTKMMELMSEDESDLEALEEGGTLAGLALDDIEKMSSQELRKALRKARKENNNNQEVHEKMVAAKDKKINKLDKELHKLDQLPVDERSNMLSQKLERETTISIGSLLGPEVVIKEILEWDESPQHIKNACCQQVDRILTALNEVRSKYMLGELMDTLGEEEWMNQVRNEIEENQNG